MVSASTVRGEYPQYPIRIPQKSKTTQEKIEYGVRVSVGGVAEVCANPDSANKLLKFAASVTKCVGYIFAEVAKAAKYVLRALSEFTEIVEILTVPYLIYLAITPCEGSDVEKRTARFSRFANLCLAVQRTFLVFSLLDATRLYSTASWGLVAASSIPAFSTVACGLAVLSLLTNLIDCSNKVHEGKKVRRDLQYEQAFWKAMDANMRVATLECAELNAKQTGENLELASEGEFKETTETSPETALETPIVAIESEGTTGPAPAAPRAEPIVIERSEELIVADEGAQKANDHYNYLYMKQLRKNKVVGLNEKMQQRHDQLVQITNHIALKRIHPDNQVRLEGDVAALHIQYKLEEVTTKLLKNKFELINNGLAITNAINKLATVALATMLTVSIALGASFVWLPATVLFVGLYAASWSLMQVVVKQTFKEIVNNREEQNKTMLENAAAQQIPYLEYQLLYKQTVCVPGPKNSRKVKTIDGGVFAQVNGLIKVGT